VNVRAGHIDQLMMMPPSVREWLPEDHLAFFVMDVVAELDLDGFYGAYRLDGRGGAVYDPATMVAVLVYAYCVGERSSRRIERRLVEDVPFRVIAANQQPDHATLARFRRRHQDAVAGLFSQVLRLCVRAGLVDAGIVSIDGTKLAANASFFANRDRASLAAELGSGEADAAREAAERAFVEAEQIDAAEDAEHDDGRGRGLPSEWAGGVDRRSRIRAALEELDSQKAHDFESRLAERAQKEAQLGRKLTGPIPSRTVFIEPNRGV
jgi:transposase